MSRPASETSIRPVTSDSERQACARLMSESEPWVTLGRTYEGSLEILSDLSRELYWIESATEWVGFLLISMQGPFKGYIQTICIRPECRGRGLGTEIVGWAEARILRESPNVFMCVSDFNTEAFRLYRKLGYQVVGQLDDFLVRGKGEILLRKTAGPLSEFRATR
jgi:[ribosomal protein S18]-alanine N-acetyltransferase